jgi:hypothetical protein
MLLIRCAKSGHLLEVDGEVQPDGRREICVEGYEVGNKLRLIDTHYIHCIPCEADSRCRLCNSESGYAVKFERA